MMEHIDELLAVLNQERDLYNRMKSEQKAKQNCIVRRDFAALDQCVANMEKLCWHLDGLERQRKQASQELAAALGLGAQKEDAMSLNAIATQVGGKPGESLLEVSENLSCLLDEVQALNQENAYLLGRSLRCVTDVLQALLREINETNVAYTNQGVASRSPLGVGLINQRA